MADNPAPVIETETDNENDQYDYYVEKATSLIYEAKIFDRFALVRPADPWFHSAIRKISFSDFCDDFEQYCGDSDAIRRAYATANTDDIVAVN